MITSFVAGTQKDGLRTPPEALELVAARFRALGEAIRLRILQSLEGGEMSVSALTDTVGSTQPNVSRHLRVLLEAGLIQRRQQGSTAKYSISDQTVLQLCEMVCTGVRERLEAQVGALGASAFRAPRGPAGTKAAVRARTKG